MMWKIDHPSPLVAFVRQGSGQLPFSVLSCLCGHVTASSSSSDTRSLLHANVPFVRVERLLSKGNIHNNVGGEHGKADHYFWVRNHSSNCWGSEGSIMYPSCECLWSSVVVGKRNYTSEIIEESWGDGEE